MNKIWVTVFEKVWSQEERFGRVRHWRGDFQRGAACCFNDFISKAHYFFLRRSHYSRILLAWPEESVRQRSENWQLPKDKWPIKKHTNKSGLIELKTQSLYLDQAIMSKWRCLFFKIEFYSSLNPTTQEKCNWKIQWCVMPTVDM